jgi:ADP-ribose pyrophosphatase YjhB (NUDIX family)
VPCVGALVHDEAGRLLVVRRGRPPSEGLWSIPGGRIEPGETGREATRREVREETGLTVRVGELVGSVERPGPDDTVYVIDDYAAEVVAGALRAGDDATQARWVTDDDLADLPLTPGLLEALKEWRQLPSQFRPETGRKAE